jgi:serine/threonine protein kinase
VAVTARRVVAGRYRLEEKIGAGAMGVVWRGTDERLGRVVAIKQVFLHSGLDDREAEEVRQRTLREGRIAARLQHPHAISVFDASIEGDEPWLVMEYLPSRSLAAVLGEQGPLEPRAVARIGRQVADALDAAHQAGIVHRDVKPGNVLLGADGTVKITDFGISRATGDLTLTRTGMLAGTPAYLAPEVARGEDSTSASDVFSLGATLYASVEGVPPFGSDDNALALLHAVAAGRVIPPTQAGPLTALLMRLLRDDPAERPSAVEARRELGRIAHGGGRGEAPMPVGGPRAWEPGPPSSPSPVSSPSASGGADAAVADRPDPATPGPSATRLGMPVPVADSRRSRAARGVRGLRTVRPTLAVVVVVLLIALLAGGVVGVALISSSGSDSTGATVAPPSGTAQDPGTAMVAAVRDYYSVVTGDHAAGWARLGPGLQAETGGFASYQAFWSTIASVQVLDANAVGTDTVRATLNFAPEGRSASRETHELGMVRAPDGRWLIDNDDRVEASSPRAATTGLALVPPPSDPTPSSSAPSTRAEAAGGGGGGGGGGARDARRAEQAHQAQQGRDERRDDERGDGGRGRGGSEGDGGGHGNGGGPGAGH